MVARSSALYFARNNAFSSAALIIAEADGGDVGIGLVRPEGVTGDEAWRARGGGSGGDTGVGKLCAASCASNVRLSASFSAAAFRGTGPLVEKGGGAAYEAGGGASYSADGLAGYTFTESFWRPRRAAVSWASYARIILSFSDKCAAGMPAVEATSKNDGGGLSAVEGRNEPPGFEEGYSDSYAIGPVAADDPCPASSNPGYCVRSTARFASSYLLSAAFSWSAVRYCGTGGALCGDTTVAEADVAFLGVESMVILRDVMARE